VLFIAPNQDNVYMQDLTICQSRDWASKTSQGQAIAVRQRAKRAIYKNVTMQGVQDTYYINKADASAYFEDCSIAGEVDFIYGDGTAFFKNCHLQPVSSSACITAPNTQTGYMGLVFDGCVIEKIAGAKDNVTGYRLGRPWGDSPAATYLNTTMKVLPSDAGWGKMSGGLVLRFHEYGSKDAAGNAIDLSKRSIDACSPAAGSDSPVLTAEQAATYTVENVFKKVAADWTPAQHAAQLTAPTPDLSGQTLAWKPVGPP
jgi:pectinesterase